jgi:hypothetical protein
VAALGSPIIGGVTLPPESLISWSQSRRQLTGHMQVEYASGAAEVLAGPAAAKWLITISGQGTKPPGLDALDRSASHAATLYRRAADGTYEAVSLTVLIWEPTSYSDTLWTPNIRPGGSLPIDGWQITLREA